MVARALRAEYVVSTGAGGGAVLAIEMARAYVFPPGPECRRVPIVDSVHPGLTGLVAACDGVAGSVGTSVLAHPDSTTVGVRFAKRSLLTWGRSVLSARGFKSVQNNAESSMGASRI